MSSSSKHTALRNYAARRGLTVSTHGTHPSTVNLNFPGAAEPLISRSGHTEEDAASYVLHCLEVLGADAYGDIAEAQEIAMDRLRELADATVVIQCDDPQHQDAAELRARHAGAFHVLQVLVAMTAEDELEALTNTLAEENLSETVKALAAARAKVNADIATYAGEV